MLFRSCYLLDENSVAWFGGYKFGFELLMLNGLLTVAGLFLISRSDAEDAGVLPDERGARGACQ